MFIQTSTFVKSNIKAFRDASALKIWLRLSDDNLVAFTLPEAQEVVAGLTHELQAEMAKQVQP